MPFPDTPMTWRHRLSSWLHLQATKVYDDWHQWEWTLPDGDKITFGCYYQYVGSWPDSVAETCSCPEE